MICTCTTLGNLGLPERITRPSMALATTMLWALTAVGFTFWILFLLTWVCLTWALPTLERGALLALGGSSLGGVFSFTGWASGGACCGLCTVAHCSSDTFFHHSPDSPPGLSLLSVRARGGTLSSLALGFMVLQEIICYQVWERRGGVLSLWALDWFCGQGVWLGCECFVCYTVGFPGERGVLQLWYVALQGWN
jgi:hypothetical protein